MKELAARSRRAKSDFYDRYRAELFGRLAIERDLAPVKVLDWQKLEPLQAARATSNRGAQLVEHIVTTYFANTANELFGEFWDLWEQQQEAIMAVGGVYADGQPLRLIPGCQGISVFLDIGATGWAFVAPSVAGVRVELAKTNKTIPATERKLKQFGVGAMGSSELISTFETFVRFVARARKHFWHGRIDESFLHFVIALDLLLGEPAASTKAIGNRVAVLVYSHFARTFEAQKKEIESLYDKRSRYVHEGQSPSETDLKAVESVCGEVLSCLLRLYSEPQNHEPGFIRQWYKNLDYLVSALQAGKLVSEEELQANGIDTGSNTR
jgi:hypothetical protein